ncbi:ABC transporter permease [Caloranaerobacter sp. DY30410]|uniref:ABC transporter permease n=1 Tax=Caloranaerobacter sp. DY30410 TaxID=3238305 RepID=UPI003D02A7DD
MFEYIIQNNNINKLLIKIGFIKYQIYKLATFFSIISSFLFIIIQYYLWMSIYMTTYIPLYDFNDMFKYLLISQIISRLYPNNVSNTISKLVKDGDICLMLLKPISITRMLLFESIGVSLYRVLVIAIPVFLITSIFFSVDILYWENILPFFVILAFSYLFVFVFESIIGILSFYTTSLWGIQSIKFAIVTILTGRFLPISLYPDWALKIVNYLPFKVMYYTPIETLLNKSSQNIYQIIVYQIVSIGVVFLIYKLLYKISIKKLMIQGG